MFINKKSKGLWIGITCVAVTLFALLLQTSDASAAIYAESDCITRWPGTWMGGGNALGVGGECWIEGVPPATTYCAPGQIYVATYKGGSVWDTPNNASTCRDKPVVSSTLFTPLNYGMERKGLCKLISIDDASLGGNLTAIIKGKPSVLKLKADGKTYELPLVPGSVVANGDGTYTAQFYTMDPVTGQALVPAGDYTARCHGTGGSNDGGSSNTVVIGY